MSNKRKLILAGGATILVVVLLFILVLAGRDDDAQQIGAEGGFQLPSYVQLDSADTYHGLVDITGTWVNTMAASDTISFNTDGTYASSSFAASGTYTLEDGYVALTSVVETSEALRMVVGNGVDIFLQMDDPSLPKSFRRVLPDESLEDAPLGTEQEEVLRHYLSSINQILQKSQWHSETDGVDEIIILSDRIQLYTGGRLASEWTYKVQAPASETGIPFTPPYTVPVVVDGLEYTLCLDAGANPEYSVGYTLSISSADNTLLLAKSTEPIIFEEP